MSGTREGGIRAAITNRMRHGQDFYARIGKNGGSNSDNGGFGSDKRGKDGLTGRERARIAGALGGRISRRRKATVVIDNSASVRTRPISEKISQNDFDLAA